ncbi:MAG: hypothetical protein IKX71_03870 [Bacteroidales bacterium]|nr:hypothetical protein [Bacteroidales bacterium]
MKKLFSILIVIFCLIPQSIGYCCTSAIFSGKVTADGRPIIWKNRDSNFNHNRVAFVPVGNGIKYSFIYLSNSKEEPLEAWSGLNSAGFSIMNTVSYNIRQEGDETPDSMMDKEGIVMYDALAACATLEDFENLLDSLDKPMGLETNFGVIDAAGGAAYYEVNNYTWIKYDVNEAPEGYIIRSNYSFSGKPNAGQGYVRYDNASQLISQHIEEGKKIDVRFIMDGLSRSYWQSAFGLNPMENGNCFFIDRDFIPRKSSVAVTIVQGVNKQEDTSECVFWAALGYPPASQIVPMKVNCGDLIPQDMMGSGEHHFAAACERSLKRKADIFYLNFGDGKRYVDLDKVRPVLKEMRAAEDYIFDNFAPQLTREQLKEFYEKVEIR